MFNKKFAIANLSNNLGEYFDSKAYEYNMTDAIREGYLAPIKTQMIPLELNISDVDMSSSDFAAGEIGCAPETDITREGAMQAFKALRAQAKKNDIADMIIFWNFLVST